MPRKSDGLSSPQTSILRDGSRTYQLAQLDVGESHTESRVIPCANLHEAAISDTRRELNRIYSSVIARAKTVGVGIVARTVVGIADNGDVVVTLVATRER